MSTTPRTSMCLFFVVICTGVSAKAELVNLPEIDTLDFYMRWGAAPGYGDLKPDWSAAEAISPDGWGFETLFEFAEGHEVAVGFDQFALRGKVGDGFQLRGAIRTLPSLAYYRNGRCKSIGFFVGLSSGLVQLSHARAYRGDEVVKVEATSFGALGLSVGVSLPWGRVRVFAELSEQSYWFPGVEYESPMSAARNEIPRSLFFAQPTVFIGMQIPFRKPPPVTPPFVVMREVTIQDGKRTEKLIVKCEERKTKKELQANPSLSAEGWPEPSCLR